MCCVAFFLQSALPVQFAQVRQFPGVPESETPAAPAAAPALPESLTAPPLPATPAFAPLAPLAPADITPAVVRSSAKSRAQLATTSNPSAPSTKQRVVVRGMSTELSLTSMLERELLGFLVSVAVWVRRQVAARLATCAGVVVRAGERAEQLHVGLGSQPRARVPT